MSEEPIYAQVDTYQFQMTKAKLPSNYYKSSTEWVYKEKAKPVLQKSSIKTCKIKDINSQKSTNVKTPGKINTTEVERLLSSEYVLTEEKGISIYLLTLRWDDH